MSCIRLLLVASALGAVSLTTPAPAADRTAANAELLEHYVAAFNAHDPDAFKDVIAPDYIQHNGRAGQGLAGLQATLRQYFATFPDFRVQLDDRVVSDDKVVARFTFTATHDHPVQLGPGAPVFPPTGRTLSWDGIAIWRVADGRFAEHWDEDDLVGLARQMRAN
jgi:predicted ester cyclase